MNLGRYSQRFHSESEMVQLVLQPDCSSAAKTLHHVRRLRYIYTRPILKDNKYTRIVKR